MSLNSRVILSVMGAHAGEDIDTIFKRKQTDISAAGSTLWLCQSPAARPDRSQLFFDDCENPNVFFLAPATPNGARPTTSAARMLEQSADKKLWSPVSSLISPVTGKASASSYALVLSSLRTSETSIDLWQYVDNGNEPIRFRLGASTLLAKHGDSSTHPNRPKSRIRRVLAIGRLERPYAVWVR